MGGKPELLIVAGDSMMDIPIMSMAQKCYYPADGEIPLNCLPDRVNVSEAYGIRAGEEILRNIVRDVKNFNSQQGLLF